MASPLLKFFARYEIARSIADGEALNHAKLDGMFADVATAIDRLVVRVNGVTTASGVLRNLAAATAQSLAGSQTFTATASQTLFTTTIVWRAAFSSSNVAVYQNGTRLRPSLVTVADASGFLGVTIAAQTVGTIIVVDAYESGAGLLATLASLENGEGASLIGIEDLAGLIDAEDIEGGLAEIATDLAALRTSLGNLSLLCRTTGFTMSDDISMGDNAITDLKAGVDDHDGVRMDQISASALLAIISPEVASAFLSLAGGTMSGPIDMAQEAITNVPDGVDDQDPVNKRQLDAIQTTVTATLSAPPGLEGMFGGPVANIPAGWLHEDGAAVSRTTYANLFAAIGTGWGIGDGTTTFNLPDKRGVYTAGAGTGVLDKVTSVTITAAGTGYTSAPTVTFTGGGGIVQATAVAILTGTAITGIKILQPGSGYTSAPTISITGGAGSGGTATASIALTSHTLGTVAGEQAHVQLDTEGARHRHLYGLQNSASAGAGAGTSFGDSQFTDYTAYPDAMPIIPPTRYSTPIIKY